MHNSKLENILNKISRLVVPDQPVGGFQVSNSSIRYLELGTDKSGNQKAVQDLAVRLAPGVVADGKIKDRKAFVDAATVMHGKISHDPKRVINVILTIPAGDIYVEVFSLPRLSEENLAGAAELNMKVVSPNPIDTSYYSWKAVGENKAGAGQLEILGAFVSKETINELSSSLEEAGFGIAAIEFSSLSLVRMLDSFGIIKSDKPYLLIKITEEGLIFIVIRNNNLYFNYFHPWGKMPETGISLSVVGATIRREGERVANFYASHWGGQIKNILFVAPSFGGELSKSIEKEYQGAEIIILDSNQDNLHGVRGAALRGATRRTEDYDINLINPGLINSFYQNQIMNFIDFWRNAATLVFAFMFIVFFATNLFLQNNANGIREREVANINDTEVAELTKLKAEANAFNTFIDSVSKANNSIYKIYPSLTKLNDAQEEDVSIARLTVRNPERVVAIEGVAKTEREAFDFKNRLSEIPEIGREIDLPLHKVVVGADGKASFSLSFTMKNL